MNEFIFVLVALVSFALITLAIRLGKVWLMALPPIFLVLANTFAAQMSEFFGVVVAITVPMYAAIFLATDIVAEHFGKREARKVVWIGFVALLALIGASQAAINVSVVEFSSSFQEAVRTIFGLAPRIALASFIAYLVSQNFDVWFFHYLKQKLQGRYLWLRNNASTVVSQGIDSVLFVSLAFYGIAPDIVSFILVLWGLKVAIALFDTPFIYLSYKLLPEHERNAARTEVEGAPSV